MGVVFCAVRAPEYLVGEIDHVSTACVELTASTHVLRVGSGGNVERARCRRPPIEQHRFVVVVRIEKADSADVRSLTSQRVQPAEAQAVVGYVQPLHLFGKRAHLCIAFHECFAVSAQSGAVPALDSGALRIEACVEPLHIVPLGSQFFFVSLGWHVPSLPLAVPIP